MLCKIMLANFIFGLLVCLVPETLGLTEDNVVEEACIQPPPIPDKNFNEKWLYEVNTWYTPYGSKEGYYRSTKNLVHNDTVLAQLKEEDVTKKSCVWVNFKPGKVTANGLKGQLEEYNINFPSKGTMVYSPVVKSHGTGGYGEMTFTDNDKFAFFAECWNGNQEGWKVLTKSSSVDKETEDKIYAHAKSLGFNEKYFFKLDYSQCGSDMPVSSEEDGPFSPFQGSSEELKGASSYEQPIYWNGDSESSKQ